MRTQCTRGARCPCIFVSALVLPIAARAARCIGSSCSSRTDVHARRASGMFNARCDVRTRLYPTLVRIVWTILNHGIGGSRAGSFYVLSWIRRCTWIACSLSMRILGLVLPARALITNNVLIYSTILFYFFPCTTRTASDACSAGKVIVGLISVACTARTALLGARGGPFYCHVFSNSAVLPCGTHCTLVRPLIIPVRARRTYCIRRGGTRPSKLCPSRTRCCAGGAGGPGKGIVCLIGVCITRHTRFCGCRRIGPSQFEPRITTCRMVLAYFVRVRILGLVTTTVASCALDWTRIRARSHVRARITSATALATCAFERV